MTTKINVHTWSKDKGILEKIDEIVIEDFYDLYLNNKKIDSMTVSPENIIELGIGYLITEGHLTPEQFLKASIIGKDIFIESKDLPNINSNSGDRKPKHVTVNLSTIERIMEKMPNMSDTWKVTGGVHWAALFDFSGNKIVYFEDIGRHNAVDRVVGHAILNNIDLQNVILASSGRQPTAMVKKAVNSKIPVVITKSPSTDKGVILAKENNVVLLGFARIDRFTAYSGVENIDFKS
nr:formate dehydrogenase accessory sulfurtransferase FdhD [Methanococcus vannielii]